jgi:hypothetical protein
MHKNDREYAINDVWKIIGNITLLEPSQTKTPDYTIQIIQKESGVDLKFWYETQEAADFIFKMKQDIFKKGIYFDSGFGVGESYIEWHLDYSIHYLEKEVIGI